MVVLAVEVMVAIMVSLPGSAQFFILESHVFRIFWGNVFLFFLVGDQEGGPVCARWHGNGAWRESERNRRR